MSRCFCHEAHDLHHLFHASVSYTALPRCLYVLTLALASKKASERCVFFLCVTPFVLQWVKGGICAEYRTCVIITVCNERAVRSDAAPDQSLPSASDTLQSFQCHNTHTNTRVNRLEEGWVKGTIRIFLHAVVKCVTDVGAACAYAFDVVWVKWHNLH